VKVFRWPLMGLILVVLAFGASACGSSDDSATKSGSGSASTGGADKQDLTVGLVQIDLSNPFHVGEVEGAKEAARRHGFTLEVRSGDGDVQKQVRAFEGLVNQKVDAIAVNAIDINAFGPALNKAKQAGIPVVSLHSPTPLAETTLGFSEYDTGKAVGKQAAKLLKERYGEPKGEVAILQGLLGQGLNKERTGGFVDELKQYAAVKIVAQEPTNWDPQKASQITENLLTAHPKLDMIYGLSDSLTIPAATVVARKGKSKQVMIVSVDGTKDGIAGVQEGKLASTFLYDPQYSGYWKAWVPWRLADGQQLPDKIDMSGVLVTTDNVGSVDKLVQAASTDLTGFPFEKSLPDIYDQFAAQS
jgi:ABC-type sugar transport system substrate-binding protein